MKNLSQEQLELLEIALQAGALKFSSLSSKQGGFKLKSERMSPYFFDAGKLMTGEGLNLVGRCYADSLIQSEIAFDVLFGPAYKGIPLVAAAAISLARRFNVNYPVAFNRKEAKDHGEGGDLIGSELAGQKVVIVDDVITAGTAVRESVECIERHGGKLKGLLLLLDRQEKGKDTDLSAVQQVKSQYDIPVVSAFTFEHLMAYVQRDNLFTPELISDMEKYREQYGVTG
jgi:orotate phosphoribosyltransferase